MSYKSAKQSLAQELEDIKAAGLWKTERIIASDQKNDIILARRQRSRQYVRQQLSRAGE